MSEPHPLQTLLHKVSAGLRMPDDSYAHRGVDGSDVEVVENHAGFMECAGCTLYDGFFGCWDVDSMVAHMQEHKQAGDGVPAYVIPTLRGY